MDTRTYGVILSSSRLIEANRRSTKIELGTMYVHSIYGIDIYIYAMPKRWITRMGSRIHPPILANQIFFNRKANC